MSYKGYLVPSELGENFPYSVLCINNKYYSFGITPRTLSSIYNEVKDKIETLTSFDINELDFDIEEFYAESD